MTFKQYFILMALGTAAAVISWLIVISAIDPLTTGFFSKITFYVTFFISSVGLLAMCGALVRILLVHKEAVVSREVAHAFRQSFLFSSVIIFSLFLASVDYLRWWTISLVVFLFAGVELFFLTSGRRDV